VRPTVLRQLLLLCGITACDSFGGDLLQWMLTPLSGTLSPLVHACWGYMQFLQARMTQETTNTAQPSVCLPVYVLVSCTVWCFGSVNACIHTLSVRGSSPALLVVVLCYVMHACFGAGLPPRGRRNQCKICDDGVAIFASSPPPLPPPLGL